MLSDMWYLYGVLLVVMLMFDAIWTRAVWPSTKDGAYEFMEDLIPLAHLTMFVTLIMVSIPLSSALGVVAGALSGFFVFAVLDMCSALRQKGKDMRLVCLDLIWGTMLFLVLSALAVLAFE